jgi:hypothetical protein
MWYIFPSSSCVLVLPTDSTTLLLTWFGQNTLPSTGSSNVTLQRQIRPGAGLGPEASNAAFDPMDIDGDFDPGAMRQSPAGPFPNSASHRSKVSIAKVATRTPNFQRRRQTRHSRRLSTGKMHKHKIKRMVSLSRMLVRHDIIDSFADSCEKVLENWLVLRSRTMLPSYICSSDPRIPAAFKAVDSAIAYKDGVMARSRRTDTSFSFCREHHKI